MIVLFCVAPRTVWSPWMVSLTRAIDVMPSTRTKVRVLQDIGPGPHPRAQSWTSTFARANVRAQTLPRQNL